MSQEYSEGNKKTRKVARSQRNRPMLVTAPEAEDAPDTDELPTSSTDSLAADMAAESEAAITEPKAQRKRPGFFSTLGKGEQSTSVKEVDVTEARLARATRGKAATKTTQVEETPQQETKVNRPATNKAPQRPPSLLKTRYMIGMLIYVLGATFIGQFVMNYMTQAHIDSVITKIGSYPLKLSTLVYLAILIVILAILLKLDLLPRNLGMGKPSASRPGQSQTRSSQNSSPGVKQTPPLMRQGVKGEHDELYQKYRSNQRREKKR